MCYPVCGGGAYTQSFGADRNEKSMLVWPLAM